MRWNRCTTCDECTADEYAYWRSEDDRYFIEADMLFEVRSSPRCSVHLGRFSSREEAARRVDPRPVFEDPQGRPWPP